MPGTFILSLDTEIAWGTYGSSGARAAAFERYPELLRRLVCQLNIYEIAATWALVGHLLLEPGERTSLPAPRYAFAHAPDSERVYSSPPAWIYGRYVADVIQSARVPQEIGSHTFTHLLATDPAVTRERFAADLAETVRVYQAYGLPAPRSLVYPQNRVAYPDLLPEYGFIAYRGVAHDWYAGLPGILQRPAHLLDRWLAFTPPTYNPVDCVEPDGLVNLPASQFLMSYDGVRGRIPTESRVCQAERGLLRAVERGEVYHLWFHPFNLGSSAAMFDALTQILARAWDLRERGDLRVMTMADVAAALTSNGEGATNRLK